MKAFYLAFAMAVLMPIVSVSAGVVVVDGIERSDELNATYPARCKKLTAGYASGTYPFAPCVGY